MKVKTEYIKSLIKLKSLSQKEVARTINVIPQHWSNWMHRGTFPHYNKLEELATLLEVEPDQLLVEKQKVLEPLLEYENAIKVSPSKDAIPFFDLELESAHTILSGKISEEIPTDFIYIPGLYADFILNYFGKEMAPIISNGDLIALREITDLSFFNYGHLYLVVTKEQIITRYVKASNKQSHIVLSAENNAYDAIEIPKKKIISIHMIISIIKRQVL